VFVRASGCNLRCRWCDTPYASWSPEGEDLSVDEIVEEVERCGRDIGDALQHGQDARGILSNKEGTGTSPQHSVAEGGQSGSEPVPFLSANQTPKHVVLTGGEPMLFAELAPLAHALRERGYHITIETAGTLFLPVECDLMSISPKMANSAPSCETDPRSHRRHERCRHAPEVIRELTARYDYQLKFVIERPDDCAEVEHYLTEFPEIDRRRVLLMPEGTDPAVLAGRARWLVSYCHEHAIAYCPRHHIDWFGPGRGR
jgi:7-carboxy-7-deazaguanine synthase